MNNAAGIVLWSKESSFRPSDDATIAKSVHHPPYTPGRYIQITDPSALPFVPSLTYFCLKKLYQYPDQVHAIGSIRLRYRPPQTPLDYDILRALMPGYNSEGMDLSWVDPRLWATLVQIYDDLPEVLYTYSIPLSDQYLPLLQQIPSTPQFTLVTILELPECKELNDETILQLRDLHGLSGLDASGTRLSAYGIKLLAGFIRRSDTEDGVTQRRGPWYLRILRLRNCKRIGNEVFLNLVRFCFLSVIGLSLFLVPVIRVSN